VGRSTILAVVIVLLLAVVAGTTHRQQSDTTAREKQTVSARVLGSPTSTMSPSNTNFRISPVENSELHIAAKRRHVGAVLPERDLSNALQNLGKVNELRSSATRGDLAAVSLLLDIAGLCAGGTQDLTGRFDLRSCMRSFGVTNSKDMDRVIVDLVGQLANSGIAVAQLEFSQRVLVMFEDGRLSKDAVADTDLVSRAQGYLVNLAESGGAEGAFCLAQAYLKGMLGSGERQLGIKYAQLARQRDPVRFANVEQMLGI
jgi:hypothetical protein